MGCLNSNLGDGRAVQASGIGARTINDIDEAAMEAIKNGIG